MERASYSSTLEWPDHNEKGASMDADTLASDIQILNSDTIEAMKYARTMTADEVDEVVDYILEEHENDPNFPPRVLEACWLYKYDEELRSDPTEYQRVYEELKVEVALFTINSPYAEVRAVVDNHDYPEMPASTFRSWFLGTLFVIIGGFINQFFSIRYPGISVGANVAQLLAFPAGKFLEKVLPTCDFTTFGYTWSLNPGEFNMKEQTVITIMANVGFSTPYIAYVVFVQYLPIYFNQPWAGNFGYQLLLALSTNFIGYGLAGLTRRFLVYPSFAIWPSNLATIALNRAFHTETNQVVNGWTISRMRWFMYCFLAMFVYFWFPNYIVQALSYFNWMTWFAPDNVDLAAITGSIGGLGLNPIPTWDWNQFTVTGNPLVNPFYSIFNGFLGTLLTAPIVLAIWYTNTWNTGYIPINNNHVWDNTGSRYQVLKVVNEDSTFNEAGYKAYSPAYLSAGNVFVYGVFFSLYTATITHTILYHRREIVAGFRSLISRKSPFADSRDIHTRLMRGYREVPEYVYLSVLAVSIALGAASIGAFPTHTSPAVVLYGVFLAVIFCIPCGIIMSITNVEITLNVIAELFGGLWFAGDANSMNYFKSYGYITTSQTLHFAQDLKLAHYVHIAPWITFNCQMWATFVSTLVCTAIFNYQMTQIPDVCLATQKDHFSCPGNNTFFTASVLWGTLGPRKMFGPGAIYNGLLWCFPIGAALPIPFYYLRKKFKIFAYFHVPIFLVGGLIWAPFNMANVWPAVPVAYVFNNYIRKRFLGWWSKYNYITSSAFSCGIAVSALVMFFALQQQDIELNWSGNSISFAGVDAAGPIRKTLAPGGHFGPGPGEF